MTSAISSGPAGQIVSGSGNISSALNLVCDYNNGYNTLQSYLTELLATVNAASANLTQTFESQMNQIQGPPYQPGDKNINVNGTDYLWLMQNVTANNFGGDNTQYSSWMSKVQALYQAANSANQAKVQALNTVSSQVQNVMSQLPQQSQNNIQLMGTIVSWAQNLVKILSD